MDSVIHQRVLDWRVLLDQHLNALLRRHPAQIGTNVVQLRCSESQDFANILLFHWLVIHHAGYQVALLSHQFCLCILVRYLVSQVKTVISEHFECFHNNDPGATVVLVPVLIAEILKIH